MRAIHHCFAAGASIALLSACVGGGAAFERPAPPPAGQAMIYLYRPGDILDAAWPLHVTDNGREIATLNSGHYRAIPVDAGHHELGTDLAGGKIVALDVAAGETYYLRYGVMSRPGNAVASFMRAYPEDAQNELRTCCKTEPDPQ